MTEKSQKLRSLHKFLIGLGAAALVVVTVIILNANLLLPWQEEHRANKKAILKYVREKYPNSKRKGGEFPMQKFPEFHKAGTMYFELDGIEFGISAEFGKIVVDGYCGARAIAQFDKIIQDGFLKPRGITAYTDYSFVDNYYEIYPYTGGLSVRITIWDQGTTPREVGWLYDFYKYWKNEGEFLRLYSVRIDIVADKQRMCHIDYREFDDFPNEEKFYSAFNVG